MTKNEARGPELLRTDKLQCHRLLEVYNKCSVCKFPIQVGMFLTVQDLGLHSRSLL